MQEKSLEEYLSSLSTQEREQYQALIQECLERKNAIRNYTANAHASLEKLRDNLKQFHENMSTLEKMAKYQYELVDHFHAEIFPLLKATIHQKPSTN